MALPLGTFPGAGMTYRGAGRRTDMERSPPFCRRADVDGCPGIVQRRRREVRLAIVVPNADIGAIGHPEPDCMAEVRVVGMLGSRQIARLVGLGRGSESISDSAAKHRVMRLAWIGKGTDVFGQRRRG